MINDHAGYTHLDFIYLYEKIENRKQKIKNNINNLNNINK